MLLPYLSQWGPLEEEGINQMPRLSRVGKKIEHPGFFSLLQLWNGNKETSKDSAFPIRKAPFSIRTLLESLYLYSRRVHGAEDKCWTCKNWSILPFKLDFCGLLNTLLFPPPKWARLCAPARELQGSAFSFLPSWQFCHHLHFLAKKIQYNLKK